MIKKLTLLLAAISVAASSAFAGASIYDSFVIVNGTFYDIGSNTSNADYGTSLGEFDTTMSITLGGQQKSSKDNGTDVTGHQLLFRIFQGAPGPTQPFSTINYGFQWNQGDTGAPGNLNNAGDQQWGTDVQGANTVSDAITLSLAGFDPGVYTLEVYSQITTDGTNAAATIFNNQGGSNYRAAFTVVPEPSSLSLLAGPAILGAWFFVRRRRA